MHAKRLILVAEEDPVIRTFLADNLTADGYEIVIADDRADALRALEVERPDLVVCDVNGETLSLLDAVRGGDGVASRIDPDTPLIVLTGQTDELSRLRFFDRGCDDVLAKPFSYHELRARVRALLARSYERRAHGLRVGPLTIDPTSRQVFLHGTPVALAKAEFALLRQLASHPTRVFTKEELLRAVWGSRSLRLQPHLGRARLPAAPEAARPRRPARRERMGRRLPAHRRPTASGAGARVGRIGRLTGGRHDGPGRSARARRCRTGPTAHPKHGAASGADVRAHS